MMLLSDGATNACRALSVNVVVCLVGSCVLKVKGVPQQRSPRADKEFLRDPTRPAASLYLLIDWLKKSIFMGEKVLDRNPKCVLTQK